MSFSDFLNDRFLGTQLWGERAWMFLNSWCRTKVLSREAEPGLRLPPSQPTAVGGLTGRTHPSPSAVIY